MKKRSLGLLMALALLLPAALAQATTTTVLMYMCGTDLQSYCVQDMYEMASVDLPEDVTSPCRRAAHTNGMTAT